MHAQNAWDSAIRKRRAPETFAGGPHPVLNVFAIDVRINR
jgi:hypothetical protein